LAGIATQHPQVDIDGLATAAREQVERAIGIDDSADGGVFAHEQAALIEGMLRGFYRYAWPLLLEQYPVIVSVEQEMEYRHGNCLFMSRPDLVMENRAGDLVYVEFKTTSSKRDQWLTSWDTAVQLHSTSKAIEQTLGRSVEAVIVQGLYKGYSDQKGKQNSPFCYAYQRGGNPPFYAGEVSYEYKPGFRKAPTWELPNGVKGWVNGMPDVVLADQFPHTAPIFINERLVEAFFTQRELREKEIALAHQMLPIMGSEALLNLSFPQNFSACANAYGKPCEFQHLCFAGIEDPLEHGFVLRTPNHPKEGEQWQTSS
jgi:hypothetical protein